MTPEKTKVSNSKSPGPQVRPLVNMASGSVGGKVPPLFRPADWISFGITTLVMFLAYFSPWHPT